MLKENNIIWQEGVYCEDKLFTIQAIYYANKIVTVPDVNYYYFRNPNSTVHTKSEKHTLDKNNAKKAVLNFLREQNAQIRDKEFWAITEQKKFLSLPLLTKKESLKTAKYYLLGLVPVLERGI